MSFFDLEVLKEKPIKFKEIMPHLKISKKMLLGQCF
jgi:DNA-binding HxlR family transcriptional regulator